MSGSFKPARLDLFLAFVYLALVTLMPYALYALTHRAVSLETARAGLANYAILFAILLSIAAFLTARNLRRGWPTLDDDEVRYTWRALVRRISLAAVLVVATIVDLLAGPIASSGVFLTMSVVPRLAYRLFKQPSRRLLLLPVEPPTPA